MLISWSMIFERWLLNRMESCSESVFSGWEVQGSFMNFFDLFGFLVGAQSSSDCSCKFRSQEDGSLLWALMQISCSVSSFFRVKGCKISSDIFSDSFNFCEFRGTSWRCLGVPEDSQFFFKFFDVGPDGGDVMFSDSFIDFLFNHLWIINDLIFNILFNKSPMGRM